VALGVAPSALGVESFAVASAPGVERAGVDVAGAEITTRTGTTKYSFPSAVVAVIWPRYVPSLTLGVALHMSRSVNGVPSFSNGISVSAEQYFSPLTVVPGAISAVELGICVAALGLGVDDC